MPDLTLTRSFASPSLENVCGHIVVAGQTFHTVERLGTPWLRLGTYRMKMDIKKTKRPVPCLRPLDCPFSTLLIHDADRDNFRTLFGCVAPGLARNTATGGVLRSRDAMDAIMELLGGFQQDREVELLITNNFPTGSGTRESQLGAGRDLMRERHGIECPVGEAELSASSAGTVLVVP